MKRVIYLVRHAEAEVNIHPLAQGREDIFTERGGQEAQSLSTYFQKKCVDDIYTSKILRARLTADEIGRGMGKVPIVLEFLKERKVSYLDSSEYIHDESFEDLKKRVITTRHFLENSHQERVIIVSHALFLRALLAHISLDDVLTEDILDRYTKAYVIGNASISKIEYHQEKARWRIDYVNSQFHLHKDALHCVKGEDPLL